MKCSFCKRKTHKWKEGWLRFQMKKHSKQVTEIIGCPEHEEEAMKLFYQKIAKK